MAKRIVQMLVTCAVEDDRTRNEVRDEIQDVLDAFSNDLTVELVESRARGRVASTFTEQEG